MTTTSNITASSGEASGSASRGRRRINAVLSAKQFDSCTFKHTSTSKLDPLRSIQFYRDALFSAVQDTVREAYLRRVEGARRGHSSMQFYRDAPFSGLPGRDGGVGMGHGSNNFKNKAEVSGGHPWHPDPQVRNRQPCRYQTCRAACSVVHQMTVRGAFHPWRRVPGAEM